MGKNRKKRGGAGGGGGARPQGQQQQQQQQPRQQEQQPPQRQQQPAQGLQRQNQPPPLQLQGQGHTNAPLQSSSPRPTLPTPTSIPPSPFLAQPSTPLGPMPPQSPFPRQPATPGPMMPPPSPFLHQPSTPVTSNLSGNMAAMSLTGSGEGGGGARPKQKQQQAVVGPGGDGPPSRLGATSASASGGSARALQIPRVKDVSQKKVGTLGRKIALRTNHFEMKLGLKEVWHYDVKFQLPFRRELRNSDKPMLFRAFHELKRQAQDIFRRPFGVVFDGMSNAYSVEQLPFGQVFEGQVETREVEDLPRMLLVKIRLKLAGKVDMTTVLHYCKFGGTSTRPFEATTVINTLLNHMNRADAKKLVVGRTLSFFKDQGPVYDLGGGKSMWVGTFTSFRAGWKPFLNVDMANKPAYEEDSVSGFCLKVLNERARNPRMDLKNLKEYEGKTVSQELKGLKIRMTINPAYKRDLKANGLGPPSNKPGVVHLEEQNASLSIEQYFRQHHNIALKFPYEPSVWVGSPNKKIFYPMELCNIKKQVCPNSKKMSEDQTANMIKRTAVPPEERKKRIEGEVGKLKQSLGGNGYAREFGLSVEDRMSRVDGRVLPAPDLGYKQEQKPDGAGDKPKTDVTVQAKGGKWAMGQNHHFVDAKSLKVWGLLDLANIRDQTKKNFVQGLYEEGSKRGVNVEFPTERWVDSRKSLAEKEDAFNRIASEIKQANNGAMPDLIMVFIERKGSPEYGIVKLIGDSHLKIPTQCVIRKNVERFNPQTLHNILLKINSKLKGTNQILPPSSSLAVASRPVMFVGADVTHPSPDAIGRKPSIAAMVGSYDPKISKYNCEISLQAGGQVVEVIVKTEEMMKSLLMRFRRATNGRKPEKIIYYRDGVSEGQFEYVLNIELSAIRRACQSLDKEYKPAITFMVAQKRHKTRLFPENPKDGMGRMGNVPPGTVVDTVIVSPTEDSFYLASHEGIQGTTKPTGYHKLWDDNNLDINELQRMTYYLCHLYARCERSVSYPAPTYYAHLAAYRARLHHDALLLKYGGPEKIPQGELDTIQMISGVDYFV